MILSHLGKSPKQRLAQKKQQSACFVMCANWPFNTPPLLMCGCLLPPAACGRGDCAPRRPPAASSERGGRLSRSASIKKRSQSGLTWPRHGHTAAALVPLRKSSPPPPPHPPRPSFHPSFRLACAHLLPSTHENAAAAAAKILLPSAAAEACLSVCHSRPHTRLPTHTHKRRSSLNYLPTCSVIPCTLHLISLLPSLSHSLRDLPHPRSFARPSCPPSCQQAYCFWQLCINTEPSLQLIRMNTARYRQEEDSLCYYCYYYFSFNGVRRILSGPAARIRE